MFAFAAVWGVTLVLLFVLMRRLQGQKPKFQKHYNHDNGRPLGTLEEMLRYAHDTTGSLILANTLVLRSKKAITGAMVRKAMEQLMRRHPILRMCYQKNQSEEYHLQKMTTLKVDLRERDTTDWKSVMEESLLEKFDGKNGPLWRVLFLPKARYQSNADEEIPEITSHPHECICIINFHHIVVDGPSYSRMFAEFKTYLSNALNNEEPQVSSMPMLPPVDLYLDEAAPSKWYHPLMPLVFRLLCMIPGFTARMMGGFAAKGNAFTRKYGVEIQRSPHIQPKTKIIPLEFTKSETSKFLKKCKEYQTTVQGAVQTAAGVSMVTMLEDQTLEVPTRVTVNIRPFLKSKVPNDYAGAYYLRVECENLLVSAPDPGMFWSMAKQASNDIHTQLKNNEPVKKWSVMKFLFPVVLGMMNNELKEEDDGCGGRRRQLLVFTNLGYAKFLDGSPEDDVILRARFGGCAEHHQGTVFDNNIVTFNGKLFWTVIHYSNIVSDAVAQKYASLVKETILKAMEI